MATRAQVLALLDSVIGAFTEYISVQLLEKRLGMIAEAVQEGTAGARLKIAKGLTAAGVIGAATVARRSRVGAALTGASLLAGSGFARFGLFGGGWPRRRTRSTPSSRSGARRRAAERVPGLSSP